MNGIICLVGSGLVLLLSSCASQETYYSKNKNKFSEKYTRFLRCTSEVEKRRGPVRLLCGQAVNGVYPDEQDQRDFKTASIALENCGYSVTASSERTPLFEVELEVDLARKDSNHVGVSCAFYKYPESKREFLESNGSHRTLMWMGSVSLTFPPDTSLEQKKLYREKAITRIIRSIPKNSPRKYYPLSTI